MPSPRALWLLLFSSGCLFVAYHWGIVAMRTGEIPVVAPFRYASIVLALILGYLIWGHVPDTISLLGIALVCMAGLYLLYRERQARIAVPLAPTVELGKAGIIA